MTTLFRAFVALLAAALLPDAVLARPADVMIIITNEEYANAIPRAGFAHRDGEAMRRLGTEVLKLPESRIISIRDATSGTLDDWFGKDGAGGPYLERLPIEKDTTIYFYYSGHGMPSRRSDASDPEAFLLPVDTPPDRAGRRGLAVTDVRKALLALQRSKAPEGRVVVMLDACFTGSSGAGELSAEARPVRLPPKALAHAEPQLVELAAAASDQEAMWDRERKHGIFTDALLEGLYGAADVDADGAVTAAEIAAFVRSQVAERIVRLYPDQRRYQVPTLAGAADMVLTRPEGAVRDPAALARMTAQCATVAAATSLTDLTAFRETCQRQCPCRKELDDRIDELTRLKTVCDGEGSVLERLVARGAAARAEVEALAAAAACPSVKARAMAWLAPPVEKKAPEPAIDPKADPAARVEPGTGKSFKDRLASGADCAHCPEMVVIPAGTFMLGSRKDEAGHHIHEGPQRRVNIAVPIAVGRFEVTFDEWDACQRDGGCRAKPGDEGFGRGRRPVINVSWNDAVAYASWLNRQTGRGYRLLTEAEWEYAARGVATEAARLPRYHFGDDERLLCSYANVADQSVRQKYPLRSVVDCNDGFLGTAPVGTFKANAFGLHDMLGNVAEWVEDCYVATYIGAPTNGTARTLKVCGVRIGRGGSWFSDARATRSAARDAILPVFRSNSVGFRVARGIVR